VNIIIIIIIIITGELTTDYAINLMI